MTVGAVTFFDKLRDAQARNDSWLCVGIDPPVPREDVLDYCKLIIDSTADLVCAVKFNLAYFFGAPYREPELYKLRLIRESVPEHLPVVLDAKFGDIEHSARHYADFAYTIIGADAVTLNPYIGTDAIRPFLADPTRGVFVLCRTSNVAGNEFQALDMGGKPLYLHVAERMAALGDEHPGQVGIVVGATQTDDMAAIVAALELTYQRRPARDAVIATAERALTQATDFARSANLVSVPATPLQIIPMPKFQQGVAIAYCDSPGPLDSKLGTFYAVSPIPSEWSKAQTTSFLREYNDYMIADVTVHEAMPGHYLQLAHANAAQSPLRAVLASGSFIEGWAVYAEGLMADQGFRGDDPLFKLTMLKMRLRSITNALLDIGIHTEGMTHEAAIKLMTQTAFQQEREAEGKWTRARLTSAQLPTYFVGFSEHSELRRAAEAKAGTAFDLKAYHDQLLSYGSPPVRYARALMFGEAIR